MPAKNKKKSNPISSSSKRARTDVQDGSGSRKPQKFKKTAQEDEEFDSGDFRATSVAMEWQDGHVHDGMAIASTELQRRLSEQRAKHQRKDSDDFESPPISPSMIIHNKRFAEIMLNNLSEVDYEE